MRHARRITLLFSLALAAAVSRAHAGGDDARPAKPTIVARREFRQSRTYPHVFEPVNYLENGAPVAMRFGPPVEDCSHRSAPALPANANGSAQKKDAVSKSTAPTAPAQTTSDSASRETGSETANTAASALHAPEPPAAAPAYPPPEGPSAPVLPTEDDADFTKIPDEVVSYFKDPYIIIKGNHRFSDPIFEPAKMEVAPKSSATYRAKK